MFLSAMFLLATLTNSPMRVTADWLSTHLNDPRIVIVEVGADKDYQTGHIPGARFIAREDVVADCDGLPNEVPSDDALIETFTRAGVGDSKRIILYSRDPLLAARAWFTLDYLGHGTRASVLDGGYEQWVESKLPVTTAVTAVAPQSFTVDGRPYSLMRLDAVKALVRQRGKIVSKLMVIDARPPLYYRGDDAGKDVPRAGHIPDSINIPWTANLASEHPPLLRSDNELRDLYTSAGITRDTIVLTYCRTGMEASMTYFVLRYLGYDVTLYDGSFVEWSRASSTPVVRNVDGRH